MDTEEHTGQEDPTEKEEEEEEEGVPNKDEKEEQVNDGKEEPENLDKREQFAATRIQSSGRGFLAKKQVEKRKSSIVKIQASGRGMVERKKVKKTKCAVRIQAHGRGHIVRKKYKVKLMRAKTRRMMQDLKEEIQREVEDRERKKRLEKAKLVLEAELLNRLKREKIKMLEARRKEKVSKKQKQLELRAKLQDQIRREERMNRELLQRCMLASKKMDTLILEAQAQAKTRKRRGTDQQSEDDGGEQGNKELIEKLDKELQSWFGKVDAASHENQKLLDHYNGIMESKQNEEGNKLLERSLELDQEIKRLEDEQTSLKNVVHQSQRKALDELEKEALERQTQENEILEEIRKTKQEIREEKRQRNELKQSYDPESSTSQNQLMTEGYTNDPILVSMHALRTQNQRLAAAIKQHQAVEAGVVPVHQGIRNVRGLLRSPREARIVEKQKRMEGMSVALASEEGKLKVTLERSQSIMEKKTKIRKDKFQGLRREEKKLREQLQDLEDKVQSVSKRKDRLAKMFAFYRRSTRAILTTE